MRNDTRVLFNAYLQQLAQLHGVADVTTKFTADPSVAQTLETRIQESSAFLSAINIYGVSEQSGEKIGISIDGTIASTTDTTVKDREPRDPSGLDDRGYNCTQTNFDTGIRYQKLDQWAKFKDFQARIRDAIIKAQALNRIMIGWNGNSRAATSNPTINKLLQDVNIGWLQKMREENPARVMTEVKEGSGKIEIGANKDFANIDALVVSMVNEFIEPWYQEDTELVVICGRQLLADKYFPIINTVQAPTEVLAADIVTSQKRLGNLPAVRVPHFPASGLMVTRLDNLSLYWQEGTRRRTVVDNAKRDRIENFESVNESYVIEDLGCAALAENITLS
ncbi:phage major capsid protein, P2 family [Pseudomonas sp. NFACC23-1]|uniref:phage major capsid protein, P2 family n=1 Tax=unclassified Pseudomonas TaxID=196821 RepID=UPI0008863DEF|nr:MULTISPECIES: phage major capsid protein, P2 family [unclassified Pseudomonas]SDB27960.1 phage major capsid protein, P2 family [Pseudomonas sp. NFACC17-2]SEJ40893.1 phage major capsid protein, P2 family [Pseudomonas sp. NFACC23-1]SFW66175.1 phage major capsid protein, P2 family [Pseudomonas sp. NFACC16-2]